MKTSIWNQVGKTTMQGWDGCASLLKPTGTGFTQGPILIDMRDNKTYEIRKFADGKCWMADNLMYGGGTDACNGKSTFNGDGSSSRSNRFGAGTYGDCIDPRTGGNAPCIAGSKVCGYFYNWQAVMQHSSAYYGVTYTGPTTNVQGLCPDGWRMASGNTSGEFYQLHLAAGSPTTGFWQPGGNWKGVLTGVYNNGSWSYRNQYGYSWTNTQNNINQAFPAFYSMSSLHFNYGSYGKNLGLPVRCVKK